MPIVSLRDFIELGRFGAISLGAERKVLEKILGEPEDVDADSFRKERRPAIMKYGDVEFHFEPSGIGARGEVVNRFPAGFQWHGRHREGSYLI
jgi:hypothetical protein